jgi:ribonuclease P protein component
MLKAPAGRARLGIVASRKVGKACVRNGIKRRLREYFRLNREKMPAQTDLVFTALKGAADLDMQQLTAELDQFFDKRF